MSVAQSTLFEKVARSLTLEFDASDGSSGSILGRAAQAYGSIPGGDFVTVPTGFDPRAAALFEAIVEACVLVLVADAPNPTDPLPCSLSELLVRVTHGVMAPERINTLIRQCEELVRREGWGERLAALGRTMTRDGVREGAQLELLRIVARVRIGCEPVGTQGALITLRNLAASLALPPTAARDALLEAERLVT